MKIVGQLLGGHSSFKIAYTSDMYAMIPVKAHLSYGKPILWLYISYVNRGKMGKKQKATDTYTIAYLPYSALKTLL